VSIEEVKQLLRVPMQSRVYRIRSMKDPRQPSNQSEMKKLINYRNNWPN
jgi:hypothetical protein